MNGLRGLEGCLAVSQTSLQILLMKNHDRLVYLLFKKSIIILIILNERLEYKIFRFPADQEEILNKKKI